MHEITEENSVFRCPESYLDFQNHIIYTGYKQLRQVHLRYLDTIDEVCTIEAPNLKINQYCSLDSYLQECK